MSAAMDAVNEVRLVGRVSAAPEGRVLPSGAEVTTLRVVVPRGTAGQAGRATVDTIDVSCWSPRTRRVAGRLAGGESVEVTGALRRRFFSAAGGRASRYEVEAATLRKA